MSLASRPSRCHLPRDPMASRGERISALLFRCERGPGDGQRDRLAIDQTGKSSTDRPRHEAVRGVDHRPNAVRVQPLRGELDGNRAEQAREDRPDTVGSHPTAKGVVLGSGAKEVGLRGTPYSSCPAPVSARRRRDRARPSCRAPTKRPRTRARRPRLGGGTRRGGTCRRHSRRPHRAPP